MGREMYCNQCLVNALTVNTGSIFVSAEGIPVSRDSRQVECAPNMFCLLCCFAVGLYLLKMNIKGSGNFLVQKRSCSSCGPLKLRQLSACSSPPKEPHAEKVAPCFPPHKAYPLLCPRTLLSSLESAFPSVRLKNRQEAHAYSFRWAK